MTEMISHLHSEVFSLPWKITVFPQLVPSLCKESNLPIYFYLLFSTPIRDKSRIIPSSPTSSPTSPLPTKRNFLYLCVKDLLNHPWNSFLRQPASKFICNPSTIRNCILQFFSEGKKAYKSMYIPPGVLCYMYNWQGCHVAVCFSPPPNYSYANLFLILMI